VDSSIRAGARGDLSRAKQIYDHYVVNTHATFDIDPPTIEEWQDWYYDAIEPGDDLFFVAERAGHVLGYVKTELFSRKSAYSPSRYTTVYLDPTATGRGIGSALYRRLFEEIDALDLHRVYAGIALPNEASIALHGKFGYAPVATFSEVGRKFDRWWDVATYEKALD
jgi:phosphinothricin acetyltransferase